MKSTLRSFLKLSLVLPALLAITATSTLAAPTASLGFGNTSVKFSPGFLQAAKTLGVDIKRISPGAVRPVRGDVLGIFPISAGSLDLATLKGEIIHKGGLKLSAGGTVVDLTDYIIDTTGAAPVLTGLVKLNGSVVTRAPLFHLALPAIKTPLSVPRSGRIEIGGVKVTLTAEAAGLLNSVYKVSAFTAGLEIGTATVVTLPLNYASLVAH